MLKELVDFDWEQVFKYAEPNDDISKLYQDLKKFTREDVVEILGSDYGSNDGPDWVIAGKLADGRYFFLSAGCDYTGWD